MAHMNERFDDKRRAMIAGIRRFPPEELNNGAFDLNWFEEGVFAAGKRTLRQAV